MTYLCDAASEYFIRPIAPADVVWAYAGVRPLYDEGDVSAHEATRDFVLEREGEPPLLNIIGGKITTFRHLAEEALKKLGPTFPGMGAAWTRGSALPGGDFSYDRRERLAADLAATFPFLDATVAAASPQPTARMARGILSGAATVTISAFTSAPASTSARSSISSATNGRCPPTTSCGGGPSSDCA